MLKDEENKIEQRFTKIKILRTNGNAERVMRTLLVNVFEDSFLSQMRA